ncbi:hypothetical protein [Couchioplanes caeruleus]|uniref:hypothetical protein n=1 Tax=Couchioplanes caeruleus TaxID=56438 RepID=UPI000A067DEA|nr:hypothetical protein [Couchioplanes caeruleus]
MTITAPLLAVLEHAWAAIRARHPEVPEVAIVTGRRGDRGGFSATQWTRAEGDPVPELQLGDGSLTAGPVAMAALLHHAAHGLAHARGIKDTSRQGRYHSKTYADLAREVGLEVSQSASTGWSQTQMPSRTADIYATVLDELSAAVGVTRIVEPSTATPSPGTSPSNNNIVALCGCPRPRRIRVAPTVLQLGPITCGLCQQPFRASE